MPRPCGWSFMWVVVVAGSVWAGDLPEGEVTLTRRWRTVRQVVQRTAEQVKVRWAMPATISRRAFLGSRNDRPTPANTILGDLARQTHLTCEVMNDVLVVHAPQDDRRTILIARLKGSNVTRKLEALCELGWLGDAQAWPALAAVAVGDEIAAALGAAQALRRLDGEEPLDWRVAGVSWSDPEFGTMADQAPAWQMPIGRAFPDGVPFEKVERLATSRYIPLREAAARLTASCGDRGKPLAEALARDRSPIVRTAATRTLRAWVDTDAIKPPTAPRLAGRTAWARRPVTNLRSVGQRLNRARKPETVWRLTGRRVGFLGTPQAIRILVRYGESDAALAEYAAVPLAEFCGGEQAIEFLMTRAAAGDGWASWGLSAMQDGEDLVASLRPILEKGRPRWDAPPEFTAARWGGVHAVRPLLRGLDKRGHWACLALGHIGDPRGVRVLAPRLNHSDPGVAVAAARGLGDSAAHAAIQPLIANLKHPDRLRRHWAVLGLGRIGGPDAAKALRERLVAERTRKDRLVRRAAAEMLKEIGPLSVEAKQLIDEFEREDAQLVPAYRPRNPRFDEHFPVNKEVFFKDHAPRTDGSTGETRVVMDWANRLMLRYGGANECVAFDVGTATWFPVRAASRFAGWNNELRPTAGGSGGMVYDGVNRLTWIGAGTGAGPHPGAATYGHDVRLAAYDAALDRFTAVPDVAPPSARRRGEPAAAFAFDPDAGLVISSASGPRGVALFDVMKRTTVARRAPRQMPALDHRPPPAFAYDPVSRRVLCTHPKLDWRLALYDVQANAVRLSQAALPGQPDIAVCGGLVYDSLNRAMILIGGVGPDRTVMPTCLYDRKADAWIDLEVKTPGALRGGGGHCVFDPEHNVILGLGGGAYRHQPVPFGTKAFYGAGIGRAP